jgi:predicted adenylyl cyclase CyaB
MSHINIEIKAHCRDPERVREVLRGAGADFKGTDSQTDTYYKISRGRLKLRQGTIENALIFYQRPDQPGPKRAEVSLYRTTPQSSLAQVLEDALEILVVVKKQREIYFLGNVKFHIDSVEGLGCFVEIEAIDADGSIGIDTLRRQCESFMKQLGILTADLINRSYSDMLLEKDAL